jgi:hypothetical protein
MSLKSSVEPFHGLPAMYTLNFAEKSFCFKDLLFSIMIFQEKFFEKKQQKYLAGKTKAHIFAPAFEK